MPYFLTLSRQHSGTLLVLIALLIGTFSAPVLADSHSGDAAHMSPVVLITGANRGLGLEFARQYSSAGWTVIGTARKPAAANELRSLDIQVLQLDVTDQSSIAALATSLEDKAIDMLINNAGIFPRVSKLAQVDAGDYARTLTVNTLGPALITQALLPNLRDGQAKKIINITSQLASIGNNSGGFYGYRESKAALNMFTNSLAFELGPEGFICLTIHPGWVRTDMGGPGANLSPEESVASMRGVIDQLTADDNGTYKGYNGDTVVW